MVKVDFKNRIREVRRQRGLRQVDLARMVAFFSLKFLRLSVERESRAFVWQRELQGLWELA
jgi:hypothetical protein